MAPPEWTAQEDAALCRAWLAETAAARPEPPAGGVAMWLSVAKRMAALCPRSARAFPSCRRRWQDVLRPALARFALCVDAVEEERSGAAEAKKVLRLAEDLYARLAKAAFTLGSCWAEWRMRVAEKTEEDEEPEDGTADEWSVADDEALCRAWMVATQVNGVNRLGKVFWVIIRTSVESSGGGEEQTRTWQSCFLRWRRIKRALRDRGAEGGAENAGEETAHAQGPSQFEHCRRILEGTTVVPPQQSKGEATTEEETTRLTRAKRRLEENGGGGGRTAVEVEPEPQPMKKRGRGRPRKQTAVEPKEEEERGEKEAKQNEEDAESAADERPLRGRRRGRPRGEAASDRSDGSTDGREDPATECSDKAVDTNDGETAENEREERALHERTVAAAEDKNALLEMQLGLQCFSQTVPEDAESREYFELLRRELLQRARRRAASSSSTSSSD